MVTRHSGCSPFKLGDSFEAWDTNASRPGCRAAKRTTTAHSVSSLLKTGTPGAVRGPGCVSDRGHTPLRVGERDALVDSQRDQSDRTQARVPRLETRLVGRAGLEPAAPCVSCKCATRLRQRPVRENLPSQPPLSARAAPRPGCGCGAMESRRWLTRQFDLATFDATQFAPTVERVRSGSASSRPLTSSRATTAPFDGSLSSPWSARRTSRGAAGPNAARRTSPRTSRPTRSVPTVLCSPSSTDAGSAWRRPQTTTQMGLPTTPQSGKHAGYRDEPQLRPPRRDLGAVRAWRGAATRSRARHGTAVACRQAGGARQGSSGAAAGLAPRQVWSSCTSCRAAA